MFTVTKEPRGWITVVVSSVAEGTADDRDQIVTHEIPMLVSFLPRSEMEAAFAVDDGDGQRTEDMVARVVRDWRVRDEQGPWPVTPEKISDLCEFVPGFGRAFVLAYANAWAGQAKVREKN